MAGSACGPSLRSAQTALEAGRDDEAIEILEQLSVSQPEDYATRLSAGIAWYRRARAALDGRRESDYLNALHRSQDHLVEAVRIAPRNAEPHLWMGVALTYRGDLEAALSSFRTARRLERGNPVHALNLAQLLIYDGKLDEADRWIRRGRSSGPSLLAFYHFDRSLLHWRRGKLRQAQRHFARMYALDPNFLSEWDIAPVEPPIDTFRELTAYCCSTVACGPYMADACARVKQPVAQREVSAETVRQELVQEMERRRRLREIYESERGLEIEVVPPDDPNVPAPTGP